MKELLEVKGNDHVLEIGFGTGKLIYEMSKGITNGLIEGIDISDTMIDIARRRNRKPIQQGKVIIKQSGFEEIEYDDNRFDKICSSNTIYFWPEPGHIIKKIHRILKPDGTLILAFEDRKQLERRSLNPDVFRIYHEDEMKDILQRNGFSREICIRTLSRGANSFHCCLAVK